MTRAAVVITVHNAAQQVRRPLDALRPVVARVAGLEIIVVDDRSTDDLADVVREYPGVRLIRVDESPPRDRTARQAALDVGWRSTSAELVLFLDADALVPAGWVETMTEALGTAPVVSWPLAYVSTNGNGLTADLQTADAGFYRLVCRALEAAHLPSGVCLGALGVRRDWLGAVGGFAAHGFTLTEDLALARATTARGGRIAFPSGPAVGVLAARSWNEVIQRAVRTSTTGGWSWLAATLALWVGSLPLVCVLALLGVVSWWVPLLRWTAGAVLVLIGVALGKGRPSLLAAATYELVAFVTSLAVLRAGRRHHTVEWGGMTYTLDPPGHATP